MALTSTPAPPDMQTLLAAYHRRIEQARRSQVGAATALAVGVLWLGVAVAFYLDWLTEAGVILGAACTLLLVVAALLIEQRGRSSLADTARLLDARLDNRQRLTTSVELLDGPAAGPLAQAQLSTSAALLGRANPEAVAPTRSPWPMLVVSLGLLLVALSIFVLKQTPGTLFAPGSLPSEGPGLGVLATPTTDAGLPGADTPPGGTGPVEGTEPQQLGPGTDPISAAQQAASQEAKAALDRLATALDAQSVTQAAADSLRAGQYDQAAAQLTEVGKQNDQLSTAAKQGLATALNQAASDTPSPPELQGAEQSAAVALQGGDYSNIARALQVLGDAVKQTGDKIISQPDLAKSFPDQSGQGGAGQGAVSPPPAGAQAGQDAGGTGSGQASQGNPDAASSTPTGSTDTSQGPGQGDGTGDQSGTGTGQGQGDPSGGSGQGDQAGQNGAPGTGGANPNGSGTNAGGSPGEGSKVSGPDTTAPLDVAGTPFELQAQPDPNQTSPPDPNQPPGLTIDGNGSGSTGTTPLAPGSPGSAPSESNQIPVQRWDPVQRYFSHDEDK